jgi:hypothetical protein
MNHLPLIVVEVVLVFGGVIAFAWWQFRDLARERAKREAARRQEQAQNGSDAGLHAPPVLKGGPRSPR